MNITLRKSNTIQTAINEVIKSIDLATEVSINEFQHAEAEVARVATKLDQDIRRKVGLMACLYDIRKSVATANSASGIDQLLTDLAFIDKQIAVYTPLITKTVRLDTQVLEGKLTKIRERASDARASLYGHLDDVSTSVLTVEVLADFKAKLSALKKHKQKYQDQILELNVRTEIQLNENVLATLQAEQLV